MNFQIELQNFCNFQINRKLKLEADHKPEPKPKPKPKPNETKIQNLILFILVKKSTNV